jgi:hypothetical protein
MYQSVEFFMLEFIHFIRCYSVCTPKGLISVVGTIPPRNWNTRQLPREPKQKEPEMGEGSSPMVVKQLEFSPRPKPVIRTSTKKIFTQPSAFGDIDASIGTKAILLVIAQFVDARKAKE